MILVFLLLQFGLELLDHCILAFNDVHHAPKAFSLPLCRLDPVVNCLEFADEGLGVDPILIILIHFKIILSIVVIFWVSILSISTLLAPIPSRLLPLLLSLI